jgi:hypothetical protein
MPARPPSPAPADEDDAPPITPFWRRLNDFFLFPFQTEPLIIAVLLSLAGYVVFLGLLGILIGGALISLGIARYAFKVAALASRGVLHSSRYTKNMEDEDWKYLPWMLFGVLIVHGFIIGLLGHSLLGLLAMLLSSLLLPATVMVLIQTQRMMAALNPLQLLATITGIGKQYLVLWLFLFLLQIGSGPTLGLLLPIVPKALLAPAFFFVGIYFTWVMAAMTGYVMYQYHGALGIDLIQNPEANARSAAAPRERPQDTQARERDAAVSDLVQRGDLKEALAQAREWVRTSDHPLIDRKRYQRVLLLDDPVSGRLAEHTPRYVAQLLAERRNAEALAALETVQSKLPGFTLDDPASVIALAGHACKHMKTQAAAGLLRGFDKRFPNAPEVPKSYELAVRLLKQGLGRGDKALQVYQTLRKRFPDHPCTEEARWVLREELGEAPPQSKSPASGKA